MRVGNVGDSSRRIAELTRSLEALDREARAAERARLVDDRSLRVEPAVIRSRRSAGMSSPRSERAFVAELRALLGEGYVVELDRPIQRAPSPASSGWCRDELASSTAASSIVAVGLPDDDTLVFRVASPQPDPPLPWNAVHPARRADARARRRAVRRDSQRSRARCRISRALRTQRRPQHPYIRRSSRRACARSAKRRARSTRCRTALLRYLDSRTGVLAAMSHDLRTPLTRMRLRVESVHDAAAARAFRRGSR